MDLENGFRGNGFGSDGFRGNGFGSGGLGKMICEKWM